MTLSPLEAAVTELLAAVTVTATTTRIRAVEPAPGDALGAGHYLPFVVLSQLDAPWTPGTGTASVTIGIRAYAATYPAAEALCLACLAVFHRKGPRIAVSRLGTYSSVAEGGPTLDKDPDTQQPLAHGIVRLNASIQAIPA
jgi:hypothetical protein